MNRKLPNRNGTAMNDDTMTDRALKEHIARKQQVRVLADHLMYLFQIQPWEKGLIILLCDKCQQSNREALMLWIEAKISSENMNDWNYWGRELERLLSRCD